MKRVWIVVLLVLLMCSSANADIIADPDGDIANIGINGGLDINVQDPTSDIVDLYMHTHIDD